MHVEDDPSPEAAARPLLTRAMMSLACLATAGFLCLRVMRFNEESDNVVALPAFLCVATALLLIVLAVLALVRAAPAEQGPS